MAVCNSHSNIRKKSLSSYKAVFDQKYHQQLKCNISDMCECKSIFQRLKMSPNECLETYVLQHDIVDIEIDETEFEDNNSDKAYDSENEGDNLGDNAFPELLLNLDNFQIGNISNAYNAGVLDGKSVVSARAMSSAAAKSSTVAAAICPKCQFHQQVVLALVMAAVAVAMLVGGGGGSVIRYFSKGVSGGGSGGGSGVGLASGSSSGKVAVMTTAAEREPT